MVAEWPQPHCVCSMLFPDDLGRRYGKGGGRVGKRVVAGRRVAARVVTGRARGRVAGRVIAGRAGGRIAG